jgi:hypothetical protein
MAGCRLGELLPNRGTLSHGRGLITKNEASVAANETNQASTTECSAGRLQSRLTGRSVDLND